MDHPFDGRREAVHFPWKARVFAAIEARPRLETVISRIAR
jgi:hypothetical protein